LNQPFIKVKGLEAKAILSDIKDSSEQEITALFEDAREKLNKMEKQAEQKKKEIVINLAQKLEGKIRTDTISREIVKRLRGQVHEGFVRECLPAKYKLIYRVKNARKQKRQLEPTVNDKLARVTTLNQCEEKEEGEKKEVIVLGVDGKIYRQRDEEKEPSSTTTDSSNTTDKASNQSSYSSQLDQQHQEQELKKTFEKPSQLDAADKIVIVEGVSSTHKHDNEDSILSFEFPINYKDLQNYLTISYSNAEDNIKVWLNGRVNLKTGEVISSNLGRLSSSQAANG
jgi:hypothetical protein